MHHHLGVKVKDKATRDGATSVELRAIKIAEERRRRVHPNKRLTEMLENRQRKEGVGVEVRQH
jgi:hypothetical protein